MKKTMMFTLILMPLIVLGILLLSGNIVNMSTYLYVEYIEFVDQEIVLQKDTAETVSGQVKVNVFPLLANNKEVEFWSDDENIVSVSDSGELVGLEIGSTYVHAMSKENNTKKAYCRVVVTSNKAQRLSLAETQKDLYVGDTYKLNVDIYPHTAIDTALNYVSSDTQVAVVDNNGEITVVGQGNAVVTATLRSNPDLSISFSLSAKPRVTRIEIIGGNNSAEFSAKTEFKFPSIDFYPSGANEEILYRIANQTEQSVATVDESGNITFNASGTVCVEAYIPNTDFKVIKEYTSTFGGFSGINFSADSPTSIDFGDYENDKELQIKYNFAPQDVDLSKLTVTCTDANGNASNVIVLENGKLTVKRGGEAIITISGPDANGKNISASSRIFVNRTATEINFTSDSFKNGEKFVYAGSNGIKLNASGLPQDANDKIYYEYDQSLASVSDGELHFTSSVINSGYGKVKVRAYTDTGVSSEIVVVYLDKDINKFDVTQNDVIDLTLPATGKGMYSFALVQNEYVDFNDISFEVSNGTEVISNTNGSPVFTLKDKGTATITVRYLDGVGSEIQTKTIIVTATRLVEQIKDLKVTAKWGSESLQEFKIEDTNNDYKVYCSATQFKISYSLYPKNTTNQTAQIDIIQSSGDIAQVNGQTIVFEKAGWVKVKVYVDGKERQLTITSSCLYPDESTAFKNIPIGGFTLDHDNEQTVNLFDYITMLEGADKSRFAFIVEGEAFTVNNGIIKTQHGGSGKVTVRAKVFNTKTNVIEDKKLGEITVKVTQKATKTTTTKGQYFYTDSTTFDVKDLFAFSPSTANQNTDIKYEVVPGKATITGTVVNFNDAGSYVVSATVNGGTEVAKVTIVYTGDTPVVSKNETVIIKGTTVIIKPDQEVLNQSYFDASFVSYTEYITVDGVFITVNGNGKIAFGGQKYSFICLETNTVSIKLDNKECEFSDGKYVTGAKELSLGYQVEGNGSLLEYISSGYATLTFNTDKGSVDENVLKFTEAGDYKVTLTLKYDDCVVGKKVYTNTVTINTTYGVANLSATKSSDTKQFDNSNADNNYIDLTKYLSISPKPFTINQETVSAQITEGNATVDTDNPLKIKYTSGGSFEVTVKNKTDGNQTITFTFTINRYATDIKLDDVMLSQVTDYKVTGNRATMYINPVAMPQDANLGTIIDWEISTMGTSAVKPETNDRIVFSKPNEEVKITFTLHGEKDITFTVTFVTTNVMLEVDLGQDTITVPRGEPFTFISSTGWLDPSKIVFTGTVDGVKQFTDENGGVYYKFTQSFNKSVDINYDNYKINRTLISVSDKQSISPEEITLTDVKAKGDTVNGIKTKSTHTTASKMLQINTEPLNEYGANGEQLKYVFTSSDDSIASVFDTGEITFITAGAVTITVSITYYTLPSNEASKISLNGFEEKTLSYNFNVTSTYGTVTSFSGVEDSCTFIYDEMQGDKIIDLTSGITRTAPSYGVSDDTPSIIKVDGACVKIEGGKLKAVGSGTATVTVGYGTATKQVTITIDKYIDEISITENSTENQIYQVVTKEQEYTFNYNLSAMPSPTYKDITVSLEINGTTIGQEDVSKYITHSDGLVTLKGLLADNLYIVTLTATDSANDKPTASLQVVCVDNDVEVIDLSNDNDRNILLTANKKYIFENKYSENIYKITEYNEEYITVNNVGVFSANCGGKDSITLSSNDDSIAVNYFVNESVQEVRLGDTEWAKQQDSILTALGEDGIDLKQKFAPTIYPETARTYIKADSGYQSVPYVVTYEVKEGTDIATIENGILKFNKEGKVELLISCTDSSYNTTITKTIISTFGYYSSVDIKVSFDGGTDSEYMFEYTDKQKTPTVTYNYFPSDIDILSEKAEILISSSDEKVFTWQNETCVFTGGGSADLMFTYNTAQDKQTTKFGIYVIKRVESVALTYNEKSTDYVVVSGNTVKLGYNVTGDNLSAYKVTFESGNTDVATVDNQGLVAFKDNGEAVITVKIASEKNGQGVFDATDTITIRYGNYNIIPLDLDKYNKDNKETLFVTTANYVIYPKSTQGYTNFEYTVTDGTGILSVNEAGKITLTGKGGNASVTVTAKTLNDQTQMFKLNLYVYKQASISIQENKVVTALTEWEIPYRVDYDDGSMVGKTIEYTITSGQDCASVDGDGKITFTKAGSVTVTVKVMYNGQVDASAEFTIRSTCGVAEKFELYKVTLENGKEVETLVNDNDAITIKTKEKNKVTFKVKNVYPTDCQISLGLSYNTDAFSCAVDEQDKTVFKLLGLSKLENGTLNVSVSGSPDISLKITVIQLAERIDIMFNGNNVTGTNTVTQLESITLGHLFNKGEQSASGIDNKSVTWEIIEGSVYAEITQDGKLTFNELGQQITVKVTSGDGECYNTAMFMRSDITGFTINTGDYKIINNSASSYNGYVYVANQNNIDEVTFTIQVQGVTGFTGWSDFNLSTTNGSTYSIDYTTGKVTVNFGENSSAEFCEKLTVAYKNLDTKTVNIYRDGISSLEFVYATTGTDDKEVNILLDETLTENSGLQQMLVFGNQSYYNGIQNYYNLSVRTKDIRNKENESIVNCVVWELCDNNGSIINNNITYDGSIAQINTQDLHTSSVEDMYNDLFNDGAVTLSAYNLVSEKLCSYTFHFVQGVNVWDEAGYINCCSSAVLHKDIKISNNTTPVATTIYGNGNLLDLSVRNNQEDPYAGNQNKFTKKYEYVSINLVNAINVRVKGSSENNSIVQLLYIDKYAYSEFQYLYRLQVQNNSHIKRCTLHEFKYAGIISQIGFNNKKDEGGFYLEDIIMYDVGPRGIEIQYGWAYVKGFLDVYNYQNEDMVSKAFTDVNLSSISNAVMGMAENYTISWNDEKWVNMVGISTKGTDKKIYYWDSEKAKNSTTEKDAYIIDNTDGGNHQSAKGLCRISQTIGYGVEGVTKFNVTAWTYNKEANYLKCGDQWVVNEEEKYELNTDYLANTTKKLERIQTTD